VIRLALKAKNAEDDRVAESAEIIWANPESRSLAEQADAWGKLMAAEVPWRVAAERVLGMTPQEIARADADRGSDVLSQLLIQPEPMSNGVPAG